MDNTEEIPIIRPDDPAPSPFAPEPTRSKARSALIGSSVAVGALLILCTGMLIGKVFEARQSTPAAETAAVSDELTTTTESPLATKPSTTSVPKKAKPSTSGAASDEEVRDSLSQAASSILGESASKESVDRFIEDVQALEEQQRENLEASKKFLDPAQVREAEKQLRKELKNKVDTSETSKKYEALNDRLRESAKELRD